MALNWAMMNANRTPIPLPGEMTITTVDSGVELQLLIPNAPPVGDSATAGGSGGCKKLKAMGRIWLTDQRVCSVPHSRTALSSQVVLWPLLRNASYCALPITCGAALTGRTVCLRIGAKFLLRLPRCAVDLNPLHGLPPTYIRHELPNVRDQTCAKW